MWIDFQSFDVLIKPRLSLKLCYEFKIKKIWKKKFLNDFTKYYISDFYNGTNVHGIQSAIKCKIAKTIGDANTKVQHS